MIELFRESTSLLAEDPRLRAEAPEVAEVLEIARRSPEGLAAVMTVASCGVAIAPALIGKIARWATGLRNGAEVFTKEVQA